MALVSRARSFPAESGLITRDIGIDYIKSPGIDSRSPKNPPNV
jgi:hypothetical protein